MKATVSTAFPYQTRKAPAARYPGAATTRYYMERLVNWLLGGAIVVAGVVIVAYLAIVL